jgi:hypothetical protein
MPRAVSQERATLRPLTVVLIFIGFFVGALAFLLILG